MVIGRLSPYATDSTERAALAFYIASAAIFVGCALHLIVGAIAIQLPWYVDIPSPIVLYAVLWRLFDKRLWRMPLLRRMGVVRLPDLNGNYSGRLYSSHDRAEGMSHECFLAIKQSWTQISIRGEFGESRSYNSISGISVVDTNVPRLTYEYINEPREGAPPTMHVHPGTVWFDIHIGGDAISLIGEYYTGRDRRNTGSIEVARI